jgi:hypothetical protein
MAVIKIKTIKKNLQAVVNYAKNGEKTEHGILVSGVNCLPQSAYEQMALTKKFYHKEDKTLGFHIIQSFKGQEVSPQKANQIGKELAEELWGDKYQVLVCTHVNKENVHNHLVLNSVSFIDGKKYHNSNTDIAFMKDMSDRLCVKYGLSIVETNRAETEKNYRQKRIDNFNRSDEKMQKIINDIDDAIKCSKRYSDFKLNLIAKGYENIKNSGKYFSFKSPYYSRNIRLDRIYGEEYSVESINHKIYYITKEEIPVANFKKKYYKKRFTGKKLNRLLLNTSSFYRLYVHYLYAFKILPSKVDKQEFTPEYYKQKRKNTMIFEELNFIARSKFEKIADVKDYKSNIEKELPILKGQREILWRKYNKSVIENDKSNILKEINQLTEKIDIAHAQKNACIRIIDRYAKIKEDYTNEIEAKNKAAELIKEDKKKKLRCR